MSYVIQYLPRACAPVRKLRGARVDEQILLNHPGYHAGAYVRVVLGGIEQRDIAVLEFVRPGVQPGGPVEGEHQNRPSVFGEDEFARCAGHACASREL